jgi:hypothetical protein
MDRPSGLLESRSPDGQQFSEAVAVTSPDVSNGTSNPPNGFSNPRSCVTCRRRKVRCNKQQPCSNCVSHRMLCEFPSFNRQKRRRKVDKPKEDVLLQQLRRLETMVEQIGQDGSVGTTSGTTDGETPASPRLVGEATGPPSTQGLQESQLTDSFGKLLVDEDGKSRYGKTCHGSITSAADGTGQWPIRCGAP